MYTISADELNKIMCAKHNLDDFDCMVDLFGYDYDRNATYMFTVTQEKAEHIEDMSALHFESYVIHCLWIYQYFIEKGYQGEVYIK